MTSFVAESIKASYFMLRSISQGSVKMDETASAFFKMSWKAKLVGLNSLISKPSKVGIFSILMSFGCIMALLAFIREYYGGGGTQIKVFGS